MPLKTIVRRTARDELRSTRRERMASVVQPPTVVQRGSSMAVPSRSRCTPRGEGPRSQSLPDTRSLDPLVRTCPFAVVVDEFVRTKGSGLRHRESRSDCLSPSPRREGRNGSPPTLTLLAEGREQEGNSGCDCVPIPKRESREITRAVTAPDRRASRGIRLVRGSGSVRAKSRPVRP